MRISDNEPSSVILSQTKLFQKLEWLPEMANQAEAKWNGATNTKLQFLCPRIEWSGHIVFVLSVCLSVVNFNLRYNFWTVRDRDFIFGMHTPLMMPFQMTPRSMTLWPDFDLEAKNSFFDFVAAGGIL